MDVEDGLVRAMSFTLWNLLGLGLQVSNGIVWPSTHFGQLFPSCFLSFHFWEGQTFLGRHLDLHIITWSFFMAGRRAGGR